MNKRGFTLVEVLAVVSILAILMTLAGVSVFSIINDSQSKLLEEQIKGLSDTAITYLEKKYFVDCPGDFDPKNPNSTLKNKCYREVSVEELVSSGFFENKNDLCDLEKKIIVYREKSGNYSELKSYVSEDVCSY